MAQCVKNASSSVGATSNWKHGLAVATRCFYAAPNGAEDEKVSIAIKITLLRSLLYASNR